MYTPPCSRRSAGSSGRRWVFACAARPLLGCARARPSHFRRANKSARGGFNSRALHSRPGIRISAYACACARGVSLPPSPPKLIPSPARAGSSRPPRREHTRRSPAIPVRVAARACCCAVLGCIARARAPTCACGSRCQAARECEALGPRRAFFWRGGSAMAPRACSPERGMLRKKQGWPERRRSCGCSGALRATASPKQTDHPFKHDCTVLASIYSCYHECIHVSYSPHHN